MKLKSIGLLLLSILTLGWLGTPFAKLFIQNKITESDNDWNFYLPYKKYLRIPLVITLSTAFLLSFLMFYLMWSLVLGSWFTYLSFALFPIFAFGLIPTAIYLNTRETLASSLSIDNYTESTNKNDLYLLKLTEEEDLVDV